MPVSLASSGGGSITLAPPSTASLYTQTLPAATTTLVGTDTNQTLTNKTLNGTLTDGTNNLTTANCISGSAKAWVRLDSSGATLAGFNISSTSGSGTCAITMATALADSNYAVTISGVGVTSSTRYACVTTITSSTAFSVTNGGALTAATGIAVFR